MSYYYKGTVYQLDQVMQNGKRVYENIESGFKAFQNYCNKLIDKAKERQIDIDSLFEKYQELSYTIQNDFTNEGILAKAIIPTTRESFERWGDKNHLNGQIVRNYISQTGMPLDSMAQDINETYYSQITPDEIVEFMINYPGGIKEYRRLKELNDFRREFKEIIGFYPEKYQNHSLTEGSYLYNDCPF